ncbi:unnamed protein product, partial [Strongylus vulgaris]
MKLLARMKRDTSASILQDEEGQDRATPSGSVEEFCNQSTQTLDGEEGLEEVLPLYRSNGFPERLKRFVGLPPDMSLTPTDCPLEASGEKCSDVFCQSAHMNDDQLSTEDVLAMMISYAPGLVDSGDDANIT